MFVVRLRILTIWFSRIRLLILLCLSIHIIRFTITIAFLVASAWHTTIKYYIDHAIKFSGGTPTYYVAYAVLATIAAIFLTTLKH